MRKGNILYSETPKPGQEKLDEKLSDQQTFGILLKVTSNNSITWDIYDRTREVPDFLLF